MIYDNIVVGSSISALGCIMGLVKSKKKVLCIDGAEDTKKNNEKEIIYCKQNLPLKNFSFNKQSGNYFDPLEVLQSKSFGGLSNIWGANSLRFLKTDFDEWPISYNKLENYYEVCEKIMNVDHFNDEIAKEFKIKNDNINEKKLNLFSNFIKEFLHQKGSNNDFTFGLARVAIDPKCYKCSNCFFGCDDNYIFNTRDYLQNLIKEKKIEYIKNLNLEKFISKDNHIELKFENYSGQKIVTKKLFIGSGAIQTPKIVMNSLEKKIDLELKESQYFLVPCLYVGKNFNNDLQHHTLSQAQIVFKNSIKYNIGNVSYEIKYDQKLINITLKKKFGIFSTLIPNIIKKRIFVITAQINSKHSVYKATMKKEDQRLSVRENKKNKKKIELEIYSQLKVLGKKFKFISVNFFSKLGKFGRGYHLGCSIPMLGDKEINNLNQYDLYTRKNGEISNCKNVFIIDSSNFTNIPSGSLSLTVMANALRIATENAND